MGFAVVAFLMTVIFICSLLSCAGHIMCQRIVCRFKLAVPDYRLANALSSMMIGQAIMGFAVVAFLITVIFIVKSPKPHLATSCASEMIADSINCPGLPLG